MRARAAQGSPELCSRSPWPQIDTSVWLSFCLGVPLWPEGFFLLIGVGRFCRAGIWFLLGASGFQKLEAFPHPPPLNLR